MSSLGYESDAVWDRLAVASQPVDESELERTARQNSPAVVFAEIARVLAVTLALGAAIEIGLRVFNIA